MTAPDTTSARTPEDPAPTDGAPAWRRPAWFALRLAVSASVLAYLVHLLDLERLAEIAQGVRVAWWALAIATLPVAYLFLGARWNSLVRAGGIDLGILQGAWLYATSSFYGMVLPGVVGGDAVRVPAAHRATGGGLGALTAAAVIERVAGLITLVIIGGVAAALLPDRMADPLGAGLVDTLALMGAAAAALLPMGQRIGTWIAARRGRQVWLSGPIIARLLVLTAPAHIADIVGHWALSKALGLDVPLPAFFVCVPLVYLATAIPVSLGGLGIRESTLTLLLVRLGARPTDVLAMALLVYINRLVVGAVAVATDMALRRPRPEEPLD